MQIFFAHFLTAKNSQTYPHCYTSSVPESQRSTEKATETLTAISAFYRWGNSLRDEKTEPDTNYSAKWQKTELDFVC